MLCCGCCRKKSGDSLQESAKEENKGGVGSTGKDPEEDVKEAGEETGQNSYPVKLQPPEVIVSEEVVTTETQQQSFTEPEKEREERNWKGTRERLNQARKEFFEKEIESDPHQAELAWSRPRSRAGSDRSRTGSDISNKKESNIKSASYHEQLSDCSKTGSDINKTEAEDLKEFLDLEDEMSAEALQAAVSRLELVASKLETLAAKSPTTGGGARPAASGEPEAIAPFVAAYDAQILGDPVVKFREISNKIGGDVTTMVTMVMDCFTAQRNFLVIVSKSKKPTEAVMMELLKPTSDKINAIQEFREKNRASPFFNHLSGISESIPALGWVAVSPTPGPFVKDMQEAGQFFTNRVIKEFKEKDQTHVDWCRAWMGLLSELQAYIKQFHTTGVSWNAQGGDAASASKAAPAPPPPAGGAPPPPPPPGPPPPPPPADVPAAGGGADLDRSQLFAQINQGTDISKGLKHVSNDMKTHKNPALRAQGSVSGTSVRMGPTPFKSSAPTSAPKPAPKPVKQPEKPPVCELQNKKWVIEYQNGNKNIELTDTNMKQTVYAYKCVDSTIVVKGKVNSITLDNCKKVAVAFDDVLSAIELINCQSIQAQVFGKVPTVSVDKTDGFLMYLSKDSLAAEIVTAKCSEMNILVPKDDGDFVEFPLPEQFKTTWDGTKFVTTHTDSA